MKSKWLVGLAALLVSAMVIAGCADNGSGGTPSGVKEPTTAAGGSSVSPSASPSPSAPAAASKKTVYPLTVKDASGKDVTFTKAPERIVSLSPSETEVLFALGLNSKIVGVSQYDDYPEEAKSKPKMGNLQGNPEAIIAANPDIVFAGLSLNKPSVDKLTELKMNLFTAEPKTVDQAIERIALYGKITDTQEQADKVIAQMKADKQKVADALKGLKDDQKKKVYVEFSAGWTVGKGEFMDDLITLAGGVNVASDLQGWKQISEEKIIQSNPEVILFSKGVPDLEKTIRGRGGWDKIKAMQDNKVIAVDDNLLSRPGPRVTKALIDVAKAIYPDLVK
ncbi:ABC transporter substrate-binding protein [Paenibacillus koleovorans]|uniref:ABC transporter substrate-binding protein n=1 Tax=Paenibacillus koleovorans TaxID=121608 RepID=UPI000FDAF87B|nr:ABC transporter substrate-binding protein [Paenibacillus koleovorans]